MEKSTYDANQPQKSMSLRNLRNTLRALHQGDLIPLRPRASMILDDFEYPDQASAEEIWVGVDCGVSGTSIKYDGNYSLNISGSVASGTITKTESLDLNSFLELQFWHQGNTSTLQALEFFVKDSEDNESYWSATTDVVVDTWKQETLDLTTADGNNGTDADLTNIVEYGFLTDAAKDYKIDSLEAICGMCVAVESAKSGGYYNQVYVDNELIDTIKQASPTLVAPVSNPRIDILVADSDGVLTWIAGDEAASPELPLADLKSSKKMPICAVYLIPMMVKIVDYEYKDAFPSEGYIYLDMRPFLNYQKLGFDTGLDASKSATPDAGDTYFASDTGKIYKCYVDDIWVGIGDGTSHYPDIEDLILTIASTSTVDIDATGLNVGGYYLASINLTADITASGANGLDTGLEAISTWYSVWVIYNPATRTQASLLSLSATAPTMPTGYTIKRRVGWARNDADGNITIIDSINKLYTDRGDPASIDYVLTDLIEDNAWHDLNLSALLPPDAIAVELSVSYTANALNQDINFRRNGYIHVANAPGIRSQVANQSILQQIKVSCDTSQIIEYYLSSTATTAVAITVTGWYKNL